MMETELGKACLVPLADGAFAKVSPRDYERVMEHKWVKVRPKRETYKVRMLRPHAQTTGRLVPSVALHRFVLGVADGDYVSFRNKDGLDCRRGNLRVVYRKNPEPKVKAAPVVQTEQLLAPCGPIWSTKHSQRCERTWTQDGYCDHYWTCVELAITANWPGWRRVDDPPLRASKRKWYAECAI